MSSPVPVCSHTCLITTTNFRLLCLTPFLPLCLPFSSCLSVCLCACLALLSRSFPHSSPRFDMAGSWNFQSHNPRHQKFIEPGKQTCVAAGRRRRHTNSPITPSPLSFVFCLLSSSPRLVSLFMLPALPPSLHPSHLTFHLLLLFLFFPPFSLPFISLSPPLSLWQFSPIVAGMQLLSSPSPSFSCRCLTLSTSR